MRPSELAGFLGGALLGPVAALGSLLRRARLFHPSGDVYWASVHRAEGPAGALAERLPGRALVRLSGALWKSPHESLEILGCAVRFCEGNDPERGAQDLLFATARSPFTLPLALLTTRAGDFLDNDYFAIAPFYVPGMGPRQLRLRAHGGPRSAGHDRDERLATAVERGEAVFSLEVRPARGGPWSEALELRLERPAAVDQARLRFSPFRTGAGIEPRGFLHELRRIPYLLSQGARAAVG